MKTNTASTLGSDHTQRFKSLRNFAFTSTTLVTLGFLYLGFEIALYVPFVAVAFAIAFNFVLEALDAVAHDRKPRYLGEEPNAILRFMLPPYLVGLTCSFLLNPGDRIWPVVLAVALAIGSKYLLRIPYGNSRRHFLNPANFGILMSLVLFPSNSIVLPYVFSSGTGDVVDIALPAVLFLLGLSLNLFNTNRIPLIVGWFAIFIGQAVIRAGVTDFSFLPMVIAATGPIAIIFSFFMISDPGTTPEKPLHQVIFGASIAFVYMFLMFGHARFGLFWALMITCAGHGLYMYFNQPKVSVGIETPEQEPARLAS